VVSHTICACICLYDTLLHCCLCRLCLIVCSVSAPLIVYSFFMRIAAGYKQLRFVPTTRIDQSWRSGYIALPAHNVRILAQDNNSQDWFAFREPREVGRFSYYADRLVTRGPMICTIGLICLLAAFVQSALNGITKRRKT